MKKYQARLSLLFLEFAVVVLVGLIVAEIALIFLIHMMIPVDSLYYFLFVTFLPGALYLIVCHAFANKGPEPHTYHWVDYEIEKFNLNTTLQEYLGILISITLGMFFLVISFQLTAAFTLFGRELLSLATALGIALPYALYLKQRGCIVEWYREVLTKQNKRRRQT